MIGTYRDQRPAIAESAFVDQSAHVIGSVKAGERSSIWCNLNYALRRGPEGGLSRKGPLGTPENMG